MVQVKGYSGPHSPHMALSRIKHRKQKEVNLDLSPKWNKEMTKRNKYFSNFRITTITFTDNDFTNIPNFFSEMRKYLLNRPEKNVNLKEQIAKLDK